VTSKTRSRKRSRLRSRGRDLGFVANLWTGRLRGCSLWFLRLLCFALQRQQPRLRNLLLLPLMDDLLLYNAELKKSRVFFANLFFFLLFSYFGKGPGAFCNANFPCKRSRLAVLILNLCINASPLTARGSEKKGCTSGCSLLQILYRDYCVIRDTVQASMKAKKI